jgi:hypothetical protein
MAVVWVVGPCGLAGFNMRPMMAAAWTSKNTRRLVRNYTALQARREPSRHNYGLTCFGVILKPLYSQENTLKDISEQNLGLWWIFGRWEMHRPTKCRSGILQGKRSRVDGNIILKWILKTGLWESRMDSARFKLRPNGPPSRESRAGPIKGGNSFISWMTADFSRNTFNPGLICVSGVCKYVVL